MSDLWTVNENGCWIWQRALNAKGYGWRWHDGRARLAHRVAYVEAKGPVPDGLTLDHLCKNRACVNPDHLEPVTNAENCRRGAKAKINAEQAAQIRERVANGETRVAVARSFGISGARVGQIVSGNGWVGA